MIIQPGTFEQLTIIRFDVKTEDQILKELKQSGDTKAAENMKKFEISNLVSDFVILMFSEKAKLPIKVEIKLKENPGLIDSSDVYRISADYSVFSRSIQDFPRLNKRKTGLFLRLRSQVIMLLKMKVIIQF